MVRFKTEVGMDISQRQIASLEVLSNAQQGILVNTDLVQAVEYTSAITLLNGAKGFIKEMQGQLDKFSVQIKEIEAIIPDASEL